MSASSLAIHKPAIQETFGSSSPTRFLVSVDQAAIAEQALHDAFRLGRGTVAR
jgi:hypothetical protein